MAERLRRRRHVQRAALDRAGAGERARPRDDRRRPRLDRRHPRAGARALPRGAADRAGEQGPRRRLERGHADRVGRLLPAPELGRLGARATPSSGSRPSRDEHPEAAVVGPAAAQPGRLAAALRARVPDACGGSRPSTSSCASSRRARARSTPSTARGFDHDEVREAEFLMGACMLVRREAADTVGLFDEDFFMFSEETDWCYRFRQAGWKVLFTPDAEFVHVGGATTRQNWGPMFREQVRGHLRFLAKHRGPKEAERARRLLLASLRLRGARLPGRAGPDRTRRPRAGWPPRRCASCWRREDEGARAGRRRRLGERPGGDPLARPRRGPGDRGRPPAERARVPLPLRAARALARPAGRGRLHRVPRRARARRAGAGLRHARRAAERDRARRREARRALPVPVPALGGARADPDQARPARGGARRRGSRCREPPIRPRRPRRARRRTSSATRCWSKPSSTEGFKRRFGRQAFRCDDRRGGRARPSPTPSRTSRWCRR